MSYFRAGLAGLALLSAALPALAGETIEVQTDKSRMLTLPGVPGAVVVGNPAIADVTINGDKIFIHGRYFGETNLMVLGVDGNMLMDVNIVTRHVNDSAVAIYSAGVPGSVARRSYSCAPLCEVDVQMGDLMKPYFKDNIEQAQGKQELATGSKTAEAAAPPAPQ